MSVIQNIVHPLNMVPTVRRTSSIRLPCVYYFFLAVVVIRYETTATARWALLVHVRAFHDTVTGFHVCASWGCYHTSAIYIRWRFAEPTMAEAFGKEFTG